MIITITATICHPHLQAVPRPHTLTLETPSVGGQHAQEVLRRGLSVQTAHRRAHQTGLGLEGEDGFSCGLVEGVLFDRVADSRVHSLAGVVCIPGGHYADGEVWVDGGREWGLLV